MLAAPQSICCVPLVPWLQGKASNVHTQFGEDGLIEAVLHRIGITNRQCFEIGAADGRWYSNTLRLREQGWHAVLIESDPAAFQRLQRDFGDVATCIHGRITDLNRCLDGTWMDHAPDLGVIDVDGQDWYLWEDLTRYRPRVMLVEISPDEWHSVPERGGRGQAGLAAMRSLGKDKRYELVATTYCNALFVAEEAL